MSQTLTGIGNLVGAAGSVYSALQPAPNPYKGAPGTPFKGILSTPQYSLGGGTLVRKNNDFLSGQRRIRELTGQGLAEVRPGFGRLTETGVNAIRQRAAEAAGSLRAQLGRRGLLGASFADDSLTRVGAEYQQAENEFRAQAFQQEMQATNELLDREQASLTIQSTQELQELGVTAEFLGHVNQAVTTQKQLLAQLKQEELMQKYGQGGPVA